MRNINKILILFLFVMMISFLAVWEFVQSESFANVLSKSVTEFTRIRLNADIDFEKIEFEVFPPGAVIKDVKFQMPMSEKNLNFKVKRLGLFFDLLDSFQTQLTIKDIVLDDGKLILHSLNSVKNKRESNKFKIDEVAIDQNIKKVLQVINKEIPVKIRNLKLTDVAVDLFNNKFYTSDSNLSFNKKRLFIDINLKQIEMLRPLMNNIEVDSAKIDLIISDNLIQVQKASIKRKLSSFNFKGIVKNINTIKTADYDLDIDMMLDLPDIHDFVDIKKIASLNQGFTKTKCKLRGKYLDFKTKCDLKLNDFRTSFAYGESVSLKTTIDSKAIVVDDFQLLNSKEQLNLVRPFEFYNFKTNKFIEDAIEVSARSFDLKNALFYLRESLDFLRGKVTGNVLFTLGSNDFHFQTKSGTYVEDFEIRTNEDTAPLLHVKKITLESGRFDIIERDFMMDLHAFSENSEFIVKSSVKNGDFNLSINKGRFNLLDFGKLAGFDIQGVGEADIEIKGIKNKFNIDIMPRLKSFNFEGYRLNQVAGLVHFELDQKKLKFKNVSGKYGKSTIEATGVIDLSTLAIDATINHDVLNYKDMLGIYRPLFLNLNFLPEEIYGQWQAKLKILGRTTLEGIQLSGSLSGGNTYVYDESLDEFSLQFDLEDQKLNFSNIVLRKGKGRVLSAVSVDLMETAVDITGNVQSIPLTEIQNYSKVPFDLSGNVNGYFNMSIKDKIEKVETQIYLNDAQVANKSLDNSFIDLNYQRDRLRMFANIFGDTLQVSSELDLSEENTSAKKLSNVSLKTNIQDLYILLSALRGVDITDQDIVSDIKTSSKVQFNFNSPDQIDAVVNVQRLMVSKGSIMVNHSGTSEPDILIKDGRIERWNTNIRGKGFYLISKGQGNLLDEYDIATKVKIDASILEVFNKLVSKSSGSFIARVDNFSKNGQSNYNAILASNNIAIVSDLLPSIITRSDVRISYKDKKLQIDQFEAELPKGKLVLGGDVDLSNVIPQVNITYLIDEAGMTIFDKSNLTLSGKGSLIGTNLPYTLNGEINITKCNIVNEITDFGGAESITKSDLKYLPKNKTLIGNQALNLNLTVNTREPIRVINSRVDVALEGNVQVVGGEKDPRVMGKVALAPSNNRIYFQNNEYQLTKGTVYFYENEEFSNPELDFLASTNIADHKIDVRVYGQVSDYKVDLSSEPSLGQENILSLMAFGYSEDLSSNLSEAEKESITRTGVSSILFNSFKINETLKNEFGLQVNLGTQITEQEGSYLTHRNSEGAGVGRVRSATTIAIKKKINDAMSMSMTSTVGSNAGQRQSMNLNYNIDNTYSVEGVFEKRSNLEGDQENIGNSFGADLKMKWSFK